MKILIFCNNLLEFDRLENCVSQLQAKLGFQIIELILIGEIVRANRIVRSTQQESNLFGLAGYGNSSLIY